jgi:hypothetical protein
MSKANAQFLKDRFNDSQFSTPADWDVFLQAFLDEAALLVMIAFDAAKGNGAYFGVNDSDSTEFKLLALAEQQLAVGGLFRTRDMIRDSVTRRGDGAGEQKDPGYLKRAAEADKRAWGYLATLGVSKPADEVVAAPRASVIAINDNGEAERL